MRDRSDHNPARPDPSADPVIEAYKQGIDRSILRHNLRLTVQQRIDQMIDHLRTIE